jgi:glycerol-3-phosphate dehydrogenase (NAD(P)+)
VWARRAEAGRALAEKIPGVTFLENIGEVLKPASLVVFAVPAGALFECAELYGPSARGDQIVLHACRGVADGFVLPHAAIRSKTCVRKVAVLGGPLHARELHLGRPLAAVVASRFSEAIELVAKLVKGTSVRIHPTRDLVGVEIAGAISNVGVIAQGLCEGLELGETSRGVLALRGLSEAQHLGRHFGADPATFGGLAGVGDLIPRRTSSADRHLQLGLELAKGKTMSEALAAANPGSVEGIATAFAARELAKTHGLKLPLIEAVTAVLDGRSAKDVVPTLLTEHLDTLSFTRG